MDVTAIILSRHPVSNKVRAQVPAGIHVLNYVSDIRSFKSYQRSWFMAIGEVVTKWFFFLDDDDALPVDFLGVIDQAIGCADRQGAAIVYTNELIVNDAGIAVESVKGPYSQETHIKNPTMCHHLVLGRTASARYAMRLLPRGDFMPEPLLYFQMAKDGAVWLDEVGYHWHRKSTGLHRHPAALAAQVASMRWCHANRDAMPVLLEPPAPQAEEKPAAKRTTRKAKE